MTTRNCTATIESIGADRFARYVGTFIAWGLALSLAIWLSPYVYALLWVIEW
jgi:hypothetical protein